MANKARFSISGSPASDPTTGNRGYDATPGQTLNVTLENPASVESVTYSVFDPNDPESPQKSKDAPDLTWVAGTASKTLAPANGIGQITMPSDATAQSYLMRAVAKIPGEADHIYERLVVIRDSTGRRKMIPGESTEYSQRGWADAQNELVDENYDRTISSSPDPQTTVLPNITVVGAGGLVPDKKYIANMAVFAETATDHAFWRITVTLATDSSGNPTNPYVAIEPLPGWTAGAAAWTVGATTSGGALVLTGDSGIDNAKWTVNAELTRSG